MVHGSGGREMWLERRGSKCPLGLLLLFDDTAELLLVMAVAPDDGCLQQNGSLKVRTTKAGWRLSSILYHCSMVCLPGIGPDLLCLREGNKPDSIWRLKEVMKWQSHERHKSTYCRYSQVIKSKSKAAVWQAWLWTLTAWLKASFISQRFWKRLVYLVEDT